MSDLKTELRESLTRLQIASAALAEFVDSPSCVGCGHCCKAELCKIGEHLYGENGELPCGMLWFDGKRHWCGAATETHGDVSGGVG